MIHASTNSSSIALIAQSSYTDPDGPCVVLTCTNKNDGALALQSEKQQTAAAQTRCPSPDTSSGVNASFQHPGPAPVADHKKRPKNAHISSGGVRKANAK